MADFDRALGGPPWTIILETQNFPINIFMGSQLYGVIFNHIQSKTFTEMCLLIKKQVHLHVLKDSKFYIKFISGQNFPCDQLSLQKSSDQFVGAIYTNPHPQNYIQKISYCVKKPKR